MLPTIRLKSNCVEVKVAKYLTGFSPESDNGAENEYTERFCAYVKNWQRVYKLDADGVIGPKSWTKIANTAKTISTSKNKNSKEVFALQLLLNIDSDGVFGKNTKAAVVAYQASCGLEADGICGRKTWTALICGADTVIADDSAPMNADIKFVQPPNFKQYDSRWASKMYSNHGDKSQTMKSSACGPTSMADIVAQWWDVNITPYDLALKSLEWGTRTNNKGTSGTFFKKCANLYGASKYLTTSSIKTAIACLESGGYVIVCFGPGTKGKSSYQKWTKGGWSSGRL